MRWNIFSRKRRNIQPEAARLAHRAVNLAKLARVYNVGLSDDGAARLAARFADVPDAELDAFARAAAPIVGCPHGVTDLFAGYSRGCAKCPYNVRVPAGEGGGHGAADGFCALKEE